METKTNYFVAQSAISGYDKLVLIECQTTEGQEEQEQQETGDDEERGAKCQIIYKEPSPIKPEDNSHLEGMAQEIVDNHYDNYESGQFNLQDNPCEKCSCLLKARLTPITPNDAETLEENINHLMKGEDFAEIFTKKKRYG